MNLIKKEGDEIINKYDKNLINIKKHKKSNLIYNSRYSFYKHHDLEKMINFLLNQNIHIYNSCIWFR